MLREYDCSNPFSIFKEVRLFGQLVWHEFRVIFPRYLIYTCDFYHWSEHGVDLRSRKRFKRSSFAMITRKQSQECSNREATFE